MQEVKCVKKVHFLYHLNLSFLNKKINIGLVEQSCDKTPKTLTKVQISWINKNEDIQDGS